MFGLSLCHKQSQFLSQRIEMEQSLNLFISQKIELVQSHNLYLKKEDTCKKLYKNAFKNKKVNYFIFKGVKIEAAFISRADIEKCGPMGEKLLSYGAAFSHVLYSSLEAFFSGTKIAMARGSWLIFFVEDYYKEKVPMKFIKLHLIHEQTEKIFLGDHTRASKVEFSVAAEWQCLLSYCRFIHRNCPTKYYSILYQNGTLELPEESEGEREMFKNSLWEIYKATAFVYLSNTLEIFEEYSREFPFSVLKRLKEEKKGLDMMRGVISNRMREIASAHKSIFPSLSEHVEQIKNELNSLIGEMCLTLAYPGPFYLGKLWREGIVEIDDTFVKMLQKKKAFKGDQFVFDEMEASGNNGSLPADGVLSRNFEKDIIPLIWQAREDCFESH